MLCVVLYACSVDVTSRQSQMQKPSLKPPAEQGLAAHTCSLANTQKHGLTGVTGGEKMK
jgi:hypothetical protein